MLFKEIKGLPKYPQFDFDRDPSLSTQSYPLPLFETKTVTYILTKVSDE